MSSILRTLAHQYQHNPYLNGYLVPKVFGNGILGNAINGALRIPALCMSCMSALLAAEITLRGLEFALERIGIGKTKKVTWITTYFHKTLGFDYRLFRATKLDRNGELTQTPSPYYNTASLITSFALVTIFAIVATEAVRMLAGKPPRIYKLAAFLGPIQVSSKSYIEGIFSALKKLRAAA